MESEKSPIPNPIPLPTQIPIQNPPSPSKTKSKSKIAKSKSKSKKSKSELPSPTIIYVPVLVQSLPTTDTSGASTSGAVPAGTVTSKTGKAVLTEQQMFEWRCQADGCTAEASKVGRYYLRHRICDEHSKAPSVLVSGVHQRYCQQCSRFHELSEFDGSRRSCRRQLCRRRLLRSLNTFSNEEDQQT